MYIPAQLYRTEASSTWLRLLGQHRQQVQALSPHQARAQFLGEKELGWGGSLGGLAEEGGEEAFSFVQKHLWCQVSKGLPRPHLGWGAQRGWREVQGGQQHWQEEHRAGGSCAGWAMEGGVC